MPNLTVVDHPLVQIRLTQMRDRNTAHEKFRCCMHEIARLMACEITRTWRISRVKVQTPLAETDGAAWARTPVLAPILRAGLGMLHGMLEVLPEARVGHIGMFRNEETKRPESYYLKTPSQLAEAEVVLLDPMLATGNSASAAAQQLKDQGAKHVSFACILCSPEGLALFQEEHPDIAIFTAAVDSGLTTSAYIIPGLGDAGDRYFGTLD